MYTHKAKKLWQSTCPHKSRTNLALTFGAHVASPSGNEGECNTFGVHVRAIVPRRGRPICNQSGTLFRTNIALTFGVARTRIPSGNGCTYVHDRFVSRPLRGTVARTCTTEGERRGRLVRAPILKFKFLNRFSHKFFIFIQNNFVHNF